MDILEAIDARHSVRSYRPDPVPEEGKINPAAILIPVFLGLSTCAGAVLVIVFVYRKNRSINPKFDPKERTDFDIDIME